MKNLLIQIDAATKPIKLHMTSNINSRLALYLSIELRHYYLCILTSKAALSEKLKHESESYWRSRTGHLECALLITSKPKRNALWRNHNCKSGNKIASEQLDVHGLMMASPLSLYFTPLPLCRTFASNQCLHIRL